MPFIQKYIVPALLLFCSIALSAQNVVISDQPSAMPDASAMLDVQSTSKGMLIPRMDSTLRKNISNPALGLLVFDTSTESFWFKDGGGWMELKTGQPSTPTGPAGQDLSGTYPNPTVARIQGQPVAATTPQQGQVMMFDNGQWKPISLPIYIPDIAIFEERYAQNICPNYADGNANTYQIRRLNTVHESSPNNSSTLINPNTSNASIQFQPGKYLINATATIIAGGAHKLFLVDPSNNNEIKLTGTNGLSDIDAAQTSSSILGIITIGTGGANLALAHKFNNATGSCVFGTTSNFTGTSEVYARIMIQKIQ